MYIYVEYTDFALSYGYPMVILWLSYGAGLSMLLKYLNSVPRVLFPRQEIGVLLGGVVGVDEANGVADVAGVTEEGTGGVETLTGDFGDGAVELHLADNLVALAPRRFGRSPFQPVGRHADVEFAICASHFIRPPVRKYLVVRHFLADLPV